MKNLKTLVLLSVVAGLAAPVLAADKNAKHEPWEASGILNVDCTLAEPLPPSNIVVVPDGGYHFYSYTGIGNGLEIATCNPITDFDTDLFILDNCVDQNELFYRDGDSGCGWATYLNCEDFTFEDGVSYIIAFGGYGGSGGFLEFTVSTECAGPGAAPENDTMAGATAMSVGDCVTGNNGLPYTDTTGGYDNSAILCDWSGYYSSSNTGASNDVWFSIELDGNPHTFSLENSSYDTALGIFDAAGTLVAGNDDMYGLVSGVECCALPAGTYYIAVDGYYNATGDFELCVTACATVGAEELPQAFELAQNHPNPFNPTTTIEFSTLETSMVSLSVFDLSGRQVASLVNGMMDAGNHSISFDASNLSSGVYFYTLQANGMSATKKMVLMK